jgi:AcrR family transcriptional regulator
MPRPKVHDDALRVRLLERAGQTLSADGLGALSLRKLAADVGTSTTAVYSLFGGKPALLKALFDEAFRRFGAHLAAAAPTGDPIEDLYRLGLAYRASALDDPHFYEVMFGSARADFIPDAESTALAASTFEPVLDAVRRAIDAGRLRAAEPGDVAVSLWAIAHGMVSLELRGYLPPGAGDPARLFGAAIRATLDGWRS